MFQPENICRFSLMGIYLSPVDSIADDALSVDFIENNETLEVDLYFKEPDMKDFQWELSGGLLMVGHKCGQAPGGLRFAIKMPQSVSDRQVHPKQSAGSLHLSIEKTHAQPYHLAEAV
ncbi:MAG: hypothetical protein V4543_15215 [Bacteroidota bacterium]